MDLTIIKEELRQAGWCCRYHGCCSSKAQRSLKWRINKTMNNALCFLILHYTGLSLSPHHLSIIDLIWSINTDLLCCEWSGYFFNSVEKYINHESSVFGLFYWLRCIWQIKLFYWSCCDDLHLFLVVCLFYFSRINT